MKRVIGRLERTLHSSAQRVRGLHRRGCAALWALDADGESVSALTESAPSPRPLGDPAHVLGLLSSADREHVLDLLRGAAPERRSHDLPLTAGDGAEHWIRIRAFAAEGQRTTLVVEDVTGHHELRAHLDRLHGDLRGLLLDAVLADERVRRRLAQDLHDTIGQALALARIRIDGLARASSPAGDLGLSEIRDLVAEAQRCVETTTFELSPPILHDLGLGAAVEWLAEHMGARHGLRVDCTIAGEPFARDRRADILLFRSVRELLMNTLRHARARSAVVRLHANDGWVEATVSDDGCGFDAASLDDAAAEGFGLFSMRERLAHIGGQVHVETAPGRGTTVRIRAPRETGDAT